MNWKKQRNNYITFYKTTYRLVRLPVLKTCLALCILILTYSCTTINLYERTAIIPKQQWQSTFHPTFTFSIQDTSSLYNVYIIIRHENMYAYNNIWVSVATTSPNDTNTKHQALNLILANNTTGWLGTGMDDIFEHRICITQAPIALKKGVYTFVLTQLMRVNPLPHILNIGVRLEKVNT